MKKLEKLEKLDVFKIENEKLLNVKGGFLAAPGDKTGGGQFSIQDYPSPGKCSTYSYSSDLDLGDGDYKEYGVKLVSVE